MPVCSDSSDSLHLGAHCSLTALCSLWTVLTVDTRPRSDVGACARLRKFRLAIYMARGKVAYKRTFCNLFHNYTIRYIYPRTRTPAPLSALASDVSRLSALCLCVQYCDCSTTQIHQGLQTPLTARLLPASCMLWEPRTARSGHSVTDYSTVWIDSGWVDRATLSRCAILRHIKRSTRRRQEA